MKIRDFFKNLQNPQVHILSQEHFFKTWGVATCLQCDREESILIYHTVVCTISFREMPDGFKIMQEMWH